MQIPILIDGAERGSLRLTQQNGAWLCEAELDDIKRVARLSIFGADASVYLGIPAPEGGRMRLVKQLRSLPLAPEYCAEGECVRSPTYNSITSEKQISTPTEKQNERKNEKESPTARHRVYRGGKAYYF